MLTLENYIESPFEFEKELKKLFGHRVSLTIFDIGACEGEDSVRFAKRFPNAQIFSFEPLPKNLDRIKQNFNKYDVKNAILFPLALSDESGTATFYVSSGQPPEANNKGWDYGNKSSSLLPPALTKKVHPWLKFKEQVTVKTERLDTFMQSHDISQVDFAYIDVQGAEMKVLKGAGELLKNIKAIWLEVEAVELYHEQPLKQDIENFMNKNQFVRIKDTVNNIAGDQLYISKDFYRKRWLQINNPLNKMLRPVLELLRPLLRKIKLLIVKKKHDN